MLFNKRKNQKTMSPREKTVDWVSIYLLCSLTAKNDMLCHQMGLEEGAKFNCEKERFKEREEENKES